MTAKIMDIEPHAEAIDSGIAANARKKIASELVSVLADTTALMLKTQACHWNVVGPTFFSLQKLTEEQYNNLFAAADVLAERIRALGTPAPFNLRMLMEKAHLSEEKDLRTTRGMIAKLVADNETVVRNMRVVAKTADEAGDFVTTDMLAARMAYHEKAIWMLRSVVAE